MTEMEQPEQGVPELQRRDPPGADEPTPRRRHKSISWKVIGSYGLIVVFATVVLFLVWSFVHRTFLDTPDQPQIMQGGKVHTIQLDVLNGTGTPKLSQRFTDYLRSRGFDVVEMGNYKDSPVELTRVIDRAGNLLAAQQVAEALGIPKERVTQQIDKTAYLDVSVVIGKDFRSLKPLQ
jgi:hypothetical protein